MVSSSRSLRELELIRSSPQRASNMHVLERWTPPMASVVKVNFDGVFLKSSGKVGLAVTIKGGKGSLLFAKSEGGNAGLLMVAECLAACLTLISAH